MSNSLPRPGYGDYTHWSQCACGYVIYSYGPITSGICKPCDAIVSNFVDSGIMLQPTTSFDCYRQPPLRRSETYYDIGADIPKNPVPMTIEHVERPTSPIPILPCRDLERPRRTHNSWRRPRVPKPSTSPDSRELRQYSRFPDDAPPRYRPMSPG
jgi:hypothetical protein